MAILGRAGTRPRPCLSTPPAQCPAHHLLLPAPWPPLGDSRTVLPKTCPTEFYFSGKHFVDKLHVEETWDRANLVPFGEWQFTVDVRSFPKSYKIRKTVYLHLNQHFPDFLGAQGPLLHTIKSSSLRTKVLENIPRQTVLWVTWQIQIIFLRAEEVNAHTNKAKGRRKHQAEHSLGGAYATAAKHLSLPPWGARWKGIHGSPHSPTPQSPWPRTRPLKTPLPVPATPLPRACCKSVVINQRDLAPLRDTGQY